ncbi:MAG: AraC family transcriptional regulator [Ruminococcus sp.]|nr:AraC family transcriptional regulator [Ruminococcus sp.]
MEAYLETKMHGKPSFPFIVYHSVLPKDMKGFPLHWHEEMEIIYVIEGNINITIQNNEYTVHKNEIALIAPESIHSIRQHNDEPAVYFNILFRFSMLSGGEEAICKKKYLDPIYERKFIMPEYLDDSNPIKSELEPLINNLTDINWPDGNKNELLIKARLLEIMHIIKNHCKKAQGDEKNANEVNRKIKKSLIYLETNYHENITIAQIAKVSNFSESYFSKLFRQLTGSSFTRYLKDYRLERAAQMLKNSDSRVSDVAFLVGFNNLSYFTRAFKTKYKINPKAYKEKYKQ